MADSARAPEDVRLRYTSVSVFETADLQAPVIGHLGQDDPLVVLGSEAEFYRLQLADGRSGYVFAHNVEGKHMPLTAGLQRTADARAAKDAQGATGWRGMVQRIRGTR